MKREGEEEKRKNKRVNEDQVYPNGLIKNKTKLGTNPSWSQ